MSYFDNSLSDAASFLIPHMSANDYFQAFSLLDRIEDPDDIYAIETEMTTHSAKVREALGLFADATIAERLAEFVSNGAWPEADTDAEEASDTRTEFRAFDDNAICRGRGASIAAATADMAETIGESLKDRENPEGVEWYVLAFEQEQDEETGEWCDVADEDAEVVAKS